MNIYIAHDHNGNPLGLLIALNKTLASLAFTSMKTEHYSIEEIDMSRVPATLPDGVGFILTSCKRKADGFLGEEYRDWKRGL